MMNQRIKIVSATSDQFIEDEKVAPSLVKEVNLKDAKTNTWSVKILYPMKNVETGGSTHRILVEEEVIGDMNKAFDRANELLRLNADVEVEYYEVKHIPHYKKGKFALKLKKDHDEDAVENESEETFDEDFNSDEDVDIEDSPKVAKGNKKSITSKKAKKVQKKSPVKKTLPKETTKVQKSKKVVKSTKKVEKKTVKKKKITKNKK